MFSASLSCITVLLCCLLAPPPTVMSWRTMVQLSHWWLKWKDKHSSRFKEVQTSELNPAGVDEQTIIDILTRRSYEQRRQIAFEYERLAKKVQNVPPNKLWCSLIVSLWRCNYSTICLAAIWLLLRHLKCLSPWWRDCVARTSSGPDHSPEGGAVRLSGGSDVGSDEEHRSVRRLRAQSLHEGQILSWSNVDKYMFCN